MRVSRSRWIRCNRSLLGLPIAILGGGLNKIYPSINKKLANQILLSGGALISEYFPDEPYFPAYLHNRNRLIAALAKGVVIIEAKEKSGSLITARYSEELNKKIFVVPGNINHSNYEGSNKLIVEGKQCIRNAEDILRSFDMFKCEKAKPKNKTNVNLPEEQKLVLKQVTKLGITIDEICLRTNLSVSEILSQLTLLEIGGYVKKAEKKYFKL